MGMKTANAGVYSRIKSASSIIASGVRLGKPEMEARGRQEFASAHVENAILIHSEHLTPEARASLARLLFEAYTAPDVTEDIAQIEAVVDAGDIVTEEDISEAEDDDIDYDEDVD